VAAAATLLYAPAQQLVQATTAGTALYAPGAQSVQPVGSTTPASAATSAADSARP
jgi:hypothetical protein